MTELIQIGLRVTEETNVRLAELSERIGISKNALILTLIDLGIRTYEAPVIREIQPE